MVKNVTKGEIREAKQTVKLYIRKLLEINRENLIIITKGLVGNFMDLLSRELETFYANLCVVKGQLEEIKMTHNAMDTKLLEVKKGIISIEDHLYTKTHKKKLSSMEPNWDRINITEIHIPPYSKEELENIRKTARKLSITEIFKNNGVDLKRKGSNYIGHCPFCAKGIVHVNPDKKIFHCFTCDKGGDAIYFLMKMQNISAENSIKATLLN